jgi:hypothetical protein
MRAEVTICAHDPDEFHERGAASSLSMVLLAPLFVVISLLAFQAAMWSHARTEARVRVRDVAGLIARSGLSSTTAQSQIREVMNPTAVGHNSLLRDVEFEVEDRSETVRVTLRARAPGIIRGTSAPVEVSTTLWRERWQP